MTTSDCSQCTKVMKDAIQNTAVAHEPQESTSSPSAPLIGNFSNPPPEILEHLFTTLIWSATRRAMWPTLACATLVCRAWSFQARRLEFIRLEIVSRLSNPNCLDYFIAHAKLIQDRGDARALPQELRITSFPTGADFHRLREVLLAVSMESVTTLEVKGLISWDGQVSVGRTKYLFPRLQHLLLVDAPLEVLQHLILACDASHLNKISIESIPGRQRRKEETLEIRDVHTLPCLRWIHVRITPDSFDAMQHILSEPITPNIEEISLYVGDWHVRPVVDLLCQRGSGTIKMLNIIIATPVAEIDQTHPVIVRLLDHAKLHAWPYTIFFSTIVRQWSIQSE